jgi:signal transduction histidine kinase
MSPRSSNAGDGDASIVVVDDDAKIRHLLAQGLYAAGYDVHAFASGEEALAEVGSNGSYDAALVDLNLPGMDGIETLKKLKERAGAVFFPGILITGEEDQDERVRGFKAGCDEYLSKPVRLYELRARLETLLARRNQHLELLRANEQLREMQERKKVLAALVVHDLRNPLSALQGNIELLREELPDAAGDVGDMLEDCQTLAAKALSMVASILDVEELEEGLLSAVPHDCKLHELVAQVTRHHSATLKARELVLENQIARDLVARLDRDLFGRMLENLLDNSVRYATRKGRVVVSAEIVGDRLEIRVGNDGPPVPADERDKIFGRYYRIEARRSGARANRGLGLYFCKLVAEAHGGSLVVIELPDLPTCFVVRIPQ